MLKRASLFFVILILTSLAAAEDYGRFDFSLAAAAGLSKQSSGNQVTLKPTQGGGVLVSGRVRFGARSALEFDYSRILNTQKFEAPPFFYNFNTSVREYTGAYVFTPFKTGKWEPFLLAGIGALSFYPRITYLNGVQTIYSSVNQTQFAYVYGAGTDYHAWKWIFVRAQYRGIIYKAPDFKLTNLFTGAHGHLAEPSIGLVFRF
ncbi:MAG TPA: outer membrane beta-barrel protein [Terriglobales bacterium]|nr:outer membrane beta-barrel protein [Terriglobales bacterium]